MGATRVSGKEECQALLMLYGTVSRFDVQRQSEAHSGVLQLRTGLAVRSAFISHARYFLASTRVTG